MTPAPGPRLHLKPGQAYHLINHGPCSLITTAAGGERNVAPINWTMPVNNDPPLMAAAVEDGITTYKLLKASGEFVINVVGESLAGKVLACGKCHGDAVNKFEKFGLTPLASSQVKPPFLKESLAHIECRLVGERPCDGVTLFIGEVAHAEVRESLWNGKSLVMGEARTLHHLTGGQFVVAERVVEVPKDKIPV